MQKMDCCIKSASPFYLSYFFLYTFSLFVPARLNNSNTLFTDYKNQHLLMVALTSVQLEYNKIIPFSYSPLKPSRFCSAVVAPAFYS